MLFELINIIFKVLIFIKNNIKGGRDLIIKKLIVINILIHLISIVNKLFILFKKLILILLKNRQIKIIEIVYNEK